MNINLFYDIFVVDIFFDINDDIIIVDSLMDQNDGDTVDRTFIDGIFVDSKSVRTKKGHLLDKIVKQTCLAKKTGKSPLLELTYLF